MPIAPAERETMERDRKKQEDPLAKAGIVGTFCRAYSIPEVIDKYLSDVYAPTDKEGRYDYIPGEGSSGVVVYEDRFVYSHHATDPAGGKLLNAFDLVRAHLFDDDDPKKSFNEMAEFAARDERVQALGLEERTARAGEDFAEPDDDDEWKKKLVRQKKSTQLENSLFNIKLIMQNDRYLRHIVFNQLADGMEIRGEVPWEHPAKFWRDADDAQLICYVDDHYRRNAKFLMNDATVSAIRKLKDGNGVYLWQPALQAGQPDKLLGFDLVTSPYAPTMAAGALPIAFGDFNNYWIGDRMGRTVQRLNELYATNGQIGFVATERVDGKVILPEGIQLLQMK